jgi:uncharacterized protein (DUF362 family)
MLSDILSSFSKREINLISIMSRPTKESLGKYHFFIDIDGHSENPAIRDALAEIHKCGEVKVLGTYPRAGKPLVNLNRPAIDLDFRPFDGKADAPGVFVASGADPYRNTREVLSRFDLNRLSGKKVLLKPNIGRNAEAGSGVVTNPRVVAAALDAFLEAGAEVAVGESPIVGVRLEEAFEKCGLAAVARKRNCRLIDMDRRKPVMIPIPDGRAIETLKVCADLFDFDFVVSIPVMKMHMHTGVSLGVKNMKGCLWGRSKVDLHMLPPIPGSNEMTLNIAIADMASVLRPHLTIVDGSVGMEGLGPSAGDPKKMDLVIAGTDALAVDATACRLMQVDPESVPHLKMAAQRGYGVIEGERIRVHPRDWIDRSHAFAPAPVNLSIRFPGVRILDENSCSACQSTLLLFLKRYGEQLFEYFPEKKEIQIAIGKGHKDVPWGTLCIGNCARRHCDRGPFVSGCPPVASAILKVLREHRGISGKPEDGPEEE